MNVNSTGDLQIWVKLEQEKAKKAGAPVAAATRVTRDE